MIVVFQHLFTFFGSILFDWFVYQHVYKNMDKVRKYGQGRKEMGCFINKSFIQQRRGLWGCIRNTSFSSLLTNGPDKLEGLSHEAFPDLCNVAPQLIGRINKLQRKLCVVSTVLGLQNIIVRLKQCNQILYNLQRHTLDQAPGLIRNYYKTCKTNALSYFSTSHFQVTISLCQSKKIIFSKKRLVNIAATGTFC